MCARHLESRQVSSEILQIVFISGFDREETASRGRDSTSEPNRLPGGNSEREPPDPISNSEVKTLSADGSVGPPHVRVGHRQALIAKSRSLEGCGFFFGGRSGRG